MQLGLVVGKCDTQLTRRGQHLCHMTPKAGTYTYPLLRQLLRPASTPAQCAVEELEGNALEGLSYLTPGEAAQVLDQFRDADPRTVRNKGACQTRTASRPGEGQNRVHAHRQSERTARRDIRGWTPFRDLSSRDFAERWAAGRASAELCAATHSAADVPHISPRSILLDAGAVPGFRAHVVSTNCSCGCQESGKRAAATHGMYPS